MNILKNVILRLIKKSKSLFMKNNLIYKEINSDSRDIDSLSKILAKIHIKLIPEGFISSLGIRFISLLYKSLIYKEEFYVLICEDQENNNKLVGYAVARLKNISYIKTIFKFNPVKIVLLTLGYAFNPKKIFGFFELFVYQLFKNPSKEGLLQNSNAAELFNIAIIESYQGQGIGKTILYKLKDKCSSMGIDFIYAVTGSTKPNTHIFYKKNGGQEIGQTTVHNNHVSKIYKIAT